MVASLDKYKRSGSGLRTTGLRTSAKRKAFKARIHRKVEEGKPLTRRERQKFNSMERSAEGAQGAKQTVVKDKQRSAEKEAKSRRWKRDYSGRWRNEKGHFVKMDALKEVGLA